jgi:hypothetical protein
MNDNILKGWLSYKSIDDELSKKALLATRNNVYQECSDFSDDNYFKLMINCNVNSSTHCLRFSECATDFINALFEKYVDDETLVITTTDEHDNVKKQLALCKNKIVLDYHNEVMCLNLSQVRREVKRYKKVFVYVIGTQISTGEITPQFFFEQLIDVLKSSNVEYKITIDDVHGMFLFPRDYRLFDFVLYTGHALIKGYDMGVIACKKSICFDFGSQMCNWAIDYLSPLTLMLERREKLFMFRAIMEDYFADLLSTDGFSSLTRTTPHIFSMLIQNVKFPKSIIDMLNEYKIRIENGGEKTYVRFRAQHYIQKPELLIEGVRKFRFILDELLNME